MDPTVVTQAVTRFADAVIFNWLVLGTDAHAKNYALLLDSAGVRLAPLYDLNSFLPYRNNAKPALSMRVGTQFRADLVSAGDWRSFAAALGLEYEYVRARLAELLVAVPAAFAEAAARPAIQQLHSPMPERLASLVAEWCLRCRRALAD